MTWTKEKAVALGARIRTLRRTQNLSQESLAYLAGITKNQIQLIEAGRGHSKESGPPSNPRMTTIHGVADAFGITASELISDNAGTDSASLSPTSD